MVASFEAPSALSKQPIEVTFLDAIIATLMMLHMFPEILDCVDVIRLIAKRSE